MVWCFNGTILAIFEHEISLFDTGDPDRTDCRIAVSGQYPIPD